MAGGRWQVAGGLSGLPWEVIVYWTWGLKRSRNTSRSSGLSNRRTDRKEILVVMNFWYFILFTRSIIVFFLCMYVWIIVGVMYGTEKGGWLDGIGYWKVHHCLINDDLSSNLKRLRLEAGASSCLSNLECVLRLISMNIVDKWTCWEGHRTGEAIAWTDGNEAWMVRL